MWTCTLHQKRQVLVCCRTSVCFSSFPWFVADCTVMKLRGRRGLRGLAAPLHALMMRGGDSPPMAAASSAETMKILGICENNRGVTETNSIIWFQNTAERMIICRGGTTSWPSN
jgi:hypothetical protein